jgi:hypothetical protein
VSGAGGRSDPPGGRWPVRAFIGVSGVYDIDKHYKHEKSRGVHEISALKPANGWHRARDRGDGLVDGQAFVASSPTWLARSLAGRLRGEGGRGEMRGEEGALHAGCALPGIVHLVHCRDDCTVPVASRCGS